jgi:uncharacterized membrane protein YesL
MIELVVNYVSEVLRLGGITMQENGFMAGFYRISEWIMRFAYLNLLWIGFTLLGFIFFGFFPATTAMFAVTRKWVMGETDLPTFQTFLGAYRAEFIKSNFLGLILFIIGLILYFDYRYLLQSSSSFGQLVHTLFLAFFFIYGLLLLYVFPVFVHFDIKVYQVIIKSLLLMFLNPITSIMMIAGSMVVSLAGAMFLILLPLISGSILSFILTWCTQHAFLKNKRKKEAFQKEGQF